MQKTIKTKSNHLQIGDRCYDINPVMSRMPVLFTVLNINLQTETISMITENDFNAKHAGYFPNKEGIYEFYFNSINDWFKLNE